MLHLLAGRQIKAAAALAASLGDVRLASWLASVNTAALGRHGQQLLQQIQVKTPSLERFYHGVLPAREIFFKKTAALQAASVLLCHPVSAVNLPVCGCRV